MMNKTVCLPHHGVCAGSLSRACGGADCFARADRVHPRYPAQNGEKHAYDIPLSTLKKTGSAKWPPRAEVLHQDEVKKKREQAAAVGAYAQYPGERPSTIGMTAVRGAPARLSRRVANTPRPPPPHRGCTCT